MESLSAAELATWWHLYQMEPWGPMRDDLRAIALTCFQNHVSSVSMIWPYWPEEPSLAELRDQMARLKAAADKA